MTNIPRHELGRNRPRRRLAAVAVALLMLCGAYTYVAPESLDFNGNWFGYASDDMVIKFTIRDNALVSASCETFTTVTFSPPPSMSGGDFSFFGNDGVGISGRIVSESQAIGTSNLPPCGPGPGIKWGASKY